MSPPQQITHAPVLERQQMENPKQAAREHPQTFPFEDLPPELRLQVYASAFEGATVTATVIRHEDPDTEPVLRFKHSAHSYLLFASRSTRDEAHHSFWSAAVVTARSTTTAASHAGDNDRLATARGAGRDNDDDDEETHRHLSRHQRRHVHVHDHACLSELARLIPRDIARTVRHLRCVKVQARLAAENPRHLACFPALRTIRLFEAGEGEGDRPVHRIIPTAHLDGTPLSSSTSPSPLPLQFRWHSWGGVWSERTFFRFKSWLADAASADGLDPREVLAQRYGIRALLDKNSKLQCVGVDSFLKFPIDVYGFARVVRNLLLRTGSCQRPAAERN